MAERAEVFQEGGLLGAYSNVRNIKKAVSVPHKKCPTSALQKHPNFRLKVVFLRSTDAVRYGLFLLDRFIYISILYISMFLVFLYFL
jgi:hypothetical protein